MQPDLKTAKSELRAKIRAALAAMTPEQRAAGSTKICARVRELAAWKNAKSVLLFAPMAVETDIWPLLAEALAAGKTAALPRYNAATRNYIAVRVQDWRNDIISGHVGIREPAAHCPEIPLNHFDLFLVPGVAFDRQGNRLGRGKGYYDRLLTGIRELKCGIAFFEQIADSVPVGPADVRMDFILTPERSLKIGD